MIETASVDALTPKQRERRRRIIQAALALAAEGGYEAVQIREVAAMADVALGTLYRYFTSKDHLLTAGMAAWTSQLVERLEQRRPTGDTPTEQVVEALRRMSRNLERQPRLTSAVVTAMGGTDPGVAESMNEVGDNLRAIVVPLLDDLDPQVREDFIDVIRHVWNSLLLQWARGRFDMAEMADALERTTRLILPCHLPGSDGRRSS